MKNVFDCPPITAKEVKLPVKRTFSSLSFRELIVSLDLLTVTDLLQRFKSTQ